jgi:hypothetical protein
VLVRTVVVQALLAPLIYSIPIRDGPKLKRCPPPTHPIESRRILHQSIDLPLNVLLLGQVEALRSLGVHVQLQHLCVVVGDRLEVGMLEAILDHFPGGICGTPS